MKEFKYYNPVAIYFGEKKLEVLRDITADRKVLIVTSPGARKRGLLDTLGRLIHNTAEIIENIPPNPDVETLSQIYNELEFDGFDTIVAVGGGSVIDSAKVLSVFSPGKGFELISSMLKAGDNPSYQKKQLIAVPTTAGTGSEVTPWATVWDYNEKKKYSFQTEDLWPNQCICDPCLTLTMPREITVQTGLDALSHSLEAIWNKNANPISTDYAVSAAKDVIEVLPKVYDELDNMGYRTKMMYAALKAGLAFSNTQTAIAHAVSYHLTMHKGIPHGLACSFLLSEIAELAIEESPKLARILESISEQNEFPLQLRHFLSAFKLNINIDKNDLDVLEMQLTREKTTQEQYYKS